MSLLLSDTSQQHFSLAFRSQFVQRQQPTSLGTRSIFFAVVAWTFDSFSIDAISTRRHRRIEHSAITIFHPAGKVHGLHDLAEIRAIRCVSRICANGLVLLDGNVRASSTRILDVEDWLASCDERRERSTFAVLYALSVLSAQMNGGIDW